MIFLDTNVLIDFADGDRIKHIEVVEFIKFCSRQKIVMSSSILCLGTFCYLLESKMKLNHIEVKNWLKNLNGLVQLLPSYNKVLTLATTSGFRDVEDALLYYTAVENQCDSFVTSNLKDFSEPHLIPVQTPAQFLEQIRS